MNEYDIAETAYKNGYEQCKKDYIKNVEYVKELENIVRGIYFNIKNVLSENIKGKCFCCINKLNYDSEFCNICLITNYSHWQWEYEDKLRNLGLRL